MSRAHPDDDSGALRVVAGRTLVPLDGRGANLDGVKSEGQQSQSGHSCPVTAR
jgi:hypothetical protein